MDARRIRITSAPIVAFGLLLALWAGPVAAADCSLNAPSGVRVGDQLNVVGAGFLASTTVDVSLTIDGGAPDEFTVDSNASGGFQISLTLETADLGRTTVVAKAGTTCSATAVYTVVGANATLPPEPTSTPPSDGAAAGATASGNPPRTDATSASGATLTGLASTVWAIAFLSVIIGLSGLIATRSTKGR